MPLIEKNTNSINIHVFMYLQNIFNKYETTNY